MRLNNEAFEKIFIEKFRGNYREAARQLETDVSQIHRIINQKQGAGLLFIERIIEWCARNGVDYRTLVILPKPFAITPTEANAGM